MNKPYAPASSKFVKEFPVKVVQFFTEDDVVTIVPKNPSAGSDFRYILPEGYIYQLVLFSFAMSTSATVATRIPDLSVVTADATKFVMQARSSGGLSASGTSFFQYGLYGVNNGTTGDPIHTMNLPENYLQAGWSVGTNTTALDATDQIGAITIVLKRWRI